MAAISGPLEKSLDYLKRVSETDYSPVPTDGTKLYEARLDRAFLILDNQAKNEEAAIKELQASAQLDTSTDSSYDLRIRLHQLRIAQTAYLKLEKEDPQLPPSDSPLPALLATRTTQNLVMDTKESISVIYESLKLARHKLALEEADLRDANSMTAALEDRIERLRHNLEEKSQKSPDEAAKALISEQRERRIACKKDTKRLTKALIKFINEHLAAMLAAEELGGPIVGDLVDITDEVLETGFNHHGKAKKRKSLPRIDDKRQQRIDHIFGRRDDTEGSEEGTRTERNVAATEMRSLVENLLNTAAEEGTGSYVPLNRDSAAARFLVRAKVAQFHPRDARRLRLIDFGRELDD